MGIKRVTMKREIKFRGWFQRFDGEEYWVYGEHYLDGNGNDCITDGCTHWGVWPVEKKVNGEWVFGS